MTFKMASFIALVHHYIEQFDPHFFFLIIWDLVPQWNEWRPEEPISVVYFTMNVDYPFVTRTESDWVFVLFVSSGIQ